MTKHKTCKDKVHAHMQGRMYDLKGMYRPYELDHNEIKTFLIDQGYDPKIFGHDENLDMVYELRSNYGLSFTYDEDLDCFTYLLSWGGPSDEVRFFVTLGGKLQKAEYWFKDWFDGACIELTGDEFETAQAIIADLNESETLKYLMEQE